MKSKQRMWAVLALVLAMVVMWQVSSQSQTVSADPAPPVAAGCAIFEVAEEDCPDAGALITEGICGIPVVHQTTPSSELSTYADYLDIAAIINHTGGPHADLLSGVQVPGGITIEVTPSGILNIQCEFDVSGFLKEDRPRSTLVSEFICGPFFDPAKNGTSRLTSNGRLLINCSWHDFPGAPPA